MRHPADSCGSRHVLVNRRLFGWDEDMMSSLLAAMPQGLSVAIGCLLYRQQLSLFTLLSCAAGIQSQSFVRCSGDGLLRAHNAVPWRLRRSKFFLLHGPPVWQCLCFALFCRLGYWWIRRGMRLLQTCCVSRRNARRVVMGGKALWCCFVSFKFLLSSLIWDMTGGN